jgi:hypothetical protein
MLNLGLSINRFGSETLPLNLLMTETDSSALTGKAQLTRMNPTIKTCRSDTHFN